MVGAIGARVIIGTVCDSVGPRYATSFVLLLIAPCVFCASLITTAGGIIAVRFFIGVGLCIFVCCQFWAGTMFSPNVVGTVNATAGGWGNLGGGCCELPPRRCRCCCCWGPQILVVGNCILGLMGTG